MKNWLYNIGLLGAIVMMVILLSGRKDDEHTIRELRARQDSLIVQNRELADKASRVIRQVDTLWRTRTIEVVRADEHKRRADEAIQIVSATDSLACPALWEAYGERTSECARLRIALQVDSFTLRLVRDSVDHLYRELDGAHILMNENARRMFELDRKTKCRIAPWVACPTRTQAFIIGAVGGLFLNKVVF